MQRKAYEDAVMWLQEEARARKDADNHVESLLRASSVAYNRGRSPRSSQRSSVDDADEAAMSYVVGGSLGGVVFCLVWTVDHVGTPVFPAGSLTWVTL
jgi:hypothetical protein